MKFFTRVLATICFAALWPSCAFAELIIGTNATFTKHAKWMIEEVKVPENFVPPFKLQIFYEDDKGNGNSKSLDIACISHTNHYPIVVAMLEGNEIELLDTDISTLNKKLPDVKGQIVKDDNTNTITLTINATYDRNDYKTDAMFLYKAHVTAGCLHDEGKLYPTCNKDIFFAVIIKAASKYQDMVLLEAPCYLSSPAISISNEEEPEPAIDKKTQLTIALELQKEAEKDIKKEASAKVIENKVVEDLLATQKNKLDAKSKHRQQLKEKISLCGECDIYNEIFK